jgi:hypothetical protein
MGEVQGHGSPKILDLREGVRQPREATHAHPHGQVLTFNQTRRDVSRIGVTCITEPSAPTTCGGLCRPRPTGSAS